MLIGGIRSGTIVAVVSVLRFRLYEGVNELGLVGYGSATPTTSSGVYLDG